MTSSLTLDAEALYGTLRDGVRRLVAERPDAALVGIWSGGAWLAARLQADLQLPGEPGVISSTLHRDDFGERGLATGAGATKLPFSIEGRHLVLIDDVLYTGRTIRAAMHELFDYGRPASIKLACLVDRSGRELPVSADFVGATLSLASDEELVLEQSGDKLQLHQQKKSQAKM